MHHFKTPLKITAIALLVALVAGIGLTTLIYRSDISHRKMTERARMLGTGVGITTTIVVFPFWIMAAGKVGRKRREAREAKKREQA